MQAVDESGDKFRVAPLGRWRSAVEFGPLAVEVWEFYRDGSGKIEEHSGAGVNVVLFKWRPQSERAIGFCEVERREARGEAEEGEPDEWMSVAYDFKVLPGPGAQVVMFEVPEDEVLKFVWTLDYLRFEGDLEA